jgi:hypothetical protein
MLGKKRAVRLPMDAYEQHGQYVYAKAEKESFWRALLRSKREDPPTGYIYPEKF